MLSRISLSPLILLLACLNLGAQNNHSAKTDLLPGSWLKSDLNHDSIAQWEPNGWNYAIKWIFHNDHTCTFEERDDAAPLHITGSSTWAYDPVTKVLTLAKAGSPMFTYKVIKLDSVTLFIKRINLPGKELDQYGTAFRRIK